MVGWLELLGAGWSTVVAVDLLRHAQVFSGDPGFALLFLGLITLSGVAGVQLLRGTDVGEVLSWVAQVVQLVQLTVGEFAFRVVVGPHVTVLYRSGQPLQFYGGLMTSLKLLRSEGDPTFGLGINLVALSALVLLLKMARRSGTSVTDARSSDCGR